MMYHHTTETDEVCAICKKPILLFWKEKEELNGQSEMTSKVNKEIVHYSCIKGAKTLQQLNEERKSNNL